MLHVKNLNKFAALTVSLAVVGMQYGCATASVTSNKATDYETEPSRVYVALKSEWFGPGFDNAFAVAFVSAAQRCGVQAKVGFVDRLALDTDSHAKMADEYDADAFLLILPDGGTKTEFDQVLTAKYDARLHDKGSENLVWRGAVNLTAGGALTPLDKKGEALSKAIVNRLVNDNIFQDCAAE